MSSRQRPARVRAALAASTTALLGLLGTALLGPVQSAVAQDGAAAAPLVQSSGSADPTRIVDVGGGDRVAISPIDAEGASVLTALPGADGAVPGLITQRTDAGTTVQTTDRSSVPTVVEGQPAAQDASWSGRRASLHFEVIGRDGRAAEAHINVFDVDNGAIWTRQLFPDENPSAECTSAAYAQTSCAVVPPGDYAVLAVVTTLPAKRPSIGASRTLQNVSIVGSPETTVHGERTVTFDARDAEPVNVRTPGHRTKVPAEGMLQIGYDRTAANGKSVHFNMHPNVLLDPHFYLQPTAEVTTGTFQTRTRIRLEAPDIELSAPFTRRLHPEYVDSTWFADFPSDFPMVDGTSRDRVVEVGHATEADLAGVELRGAMALVTHSDDLSIAEQSNRAADHGASVVVIRNDGPGDIADPGGTGVLLQVPTIRLDRAEGRALARLPKKAKVTVRGEPASPYLYDLYLKNKGRVPDDPSFVARTQDLAAQVHELHGQPTLASSFSEVAAPFQPGDTISNSRMFPFFGDARTRVEYRLPDPDTRWIYTVLTPESYQNSMFPHPDTQERSFHSPTFDTYATPGQNPLRVGAAPVIPAPNPALPVRRTGDLLRLNIEPFVDQEGNHGPGWPQGDFTCHLQVLVDGQLLGEVDNASSVTAHPPAGPSTIALRYTTDDQQPWVELSTRTDTTWTFPSDTTAGGEVVQPLLLPDYEVDVDLRNRVLAPPGTPVTFDLGLGQPEGAAPAPVQTVRVDASYDEGTTWLQATVAKQGQRWRVTLPPGTGFVSLRLRADDTAGSAIDQTVIRAFDVVG